MNDNMPKYEQLHKSALSRSRLYNWASILAYTVWLFIAYYTASEYMPDEVLVAMIGACTLCIVHVVGSLGGDVLAAMALLVEISGDIEQGS